MKRRAFISLLGGAAAWPLAARGQQPERMRRIGILMSTADDPDGQARITALREGLQKFGWTEGRNIRIEYRWAAGDADRMRTYVTLITASAERYRLPAIYAYRSFVGEGGLMSYGPDPYDIFRRAASYVDLILRGEKPSDLPVQQPTKFEFVVNLKTARALGLAIPPKVLALADEVIE
jgi:hypothetical protein